MGVDPTGQDLKRYLAEDPGTGIRTQAVLHTTTPWGPVTVGM